MKRRFALFASCLLLLVVAIWNAPVGAGAPADKPKKPTPTRAEKTKPPRPPTKRAPTKEPTQPRPTHTRVPSGTPTSSPTRTPTSSPTRTPTNTPTSSPTATSTSTPTTTNTPTLRPERPPTKEPTSSVLLPFETEAPTDTVVPIESAVLQSTPALVPTDTSTPESTPLPTIIPTSTPPWINTLAAIVFPTPFATTLAVNELLASPGRIDWNGDGAIDAEDQWVELYNAGVSRVDLSGWHLTATDGRTSFTYTFPPGTTIAGRSHRVFYASLTKLALGASGGELRLLYPDGRVADSVRFPALGPDQSFERSSDRGRNWIVDCIPSPHAPNCGAGATLTSTFDLSYFSKHIADASLIGGFDHAVLATNALLAVILSLIAGLYGSLLNDAVVSHTPQVRRMLGQFRSVSKLFGQTERWLKARIPTGFLFWVGTPTKLAALSLACGFILAFLDPSLDLREADGWMLIFGLALSIGVVSASVFAAQYLVLRLHGSDVRRRIRRGSILLVLATTVFSRIVGFVPGVLFVGSTGYEENEDSAIRAKLDLAAIAALISVGLVAWVLAPLVDADAWFKTVALLIFAAAVQTLFFQMLPFKSLHGRALFEANRLAWFELFALTALVLLQTMLNPDGSSIAVYQSPTMIIFALAVSFFAITSLVLSVYLRGIAGSVRER